LPQVLPAQGSGHARGAASGQTAFGRLSVTVVADHTVNKPLFDQPIHGAMLDLSARVEPKG